MSSVPERPDDIRPSVIFLPETFDDDARACLLACYRRLLAIAEREGVEVWPPTPAESDAERSAAAVPPALSERQMRRARSRLAQRLAAEAES